MQIQVDSEPYSSIQSDALVTYVFDEGNKIEGLLADIDRRMTGGLATLVSSGELTGKALETVLLHFPEGMDAKRLLLVGAGKPGKFAVGDLRKIAGAALRYLKSRGVKNFAFLTREGERSPAAAQAITEGLLVADFESDKYRSEKKNNKEIQSVSLAGFENGSSSGVNEAIERGRVIAESQNFARDLINEPSNRLTPRMLAAKAEAMAKEVGLGVEILDDRKITELKMGALLGVAQGSVEPPRVIVLRYEPQTPRPGAPVLGLVGKGVTFDTGGISIKPADNMEKMKYDMAGGAAMLGAMRAIALLKPRVRVVCIVCATENMPDGKAQKPGDVQTAMSGKTIEIINTDAEGRLVLADGLTYARQLGATHLIDAATLTGAVGVALGMVNAGLFSNDDGTCEKFEAGLETSGEKFWRLPLGDEYADLIKSEIGDIKNTGGRYGGAITAAEFLHVFAEDTPWIHLDIAGTAWIEDARPYMAKGPSGYAVRSVVEWVRSYGG